MDLRLLCIYKKRAFSLIEATVATGLFFILIIGGNSLIQHFSAGIVEMQYFVQAELLAKNGVNITENILKNDSPGEWAVREARLTGSPKQAFFQLEWDGTKYVLNNVTQTEEGISTASEKNTERSVFHRKIQLEEKEDWGLYEIESSVCFDFCDYSAKAYKLIKK